MEPGTGMPAEVLLIRILLEIHQINELVALAVNMLSTFAFVELPQGMR